MSGELPDSPRVTREWCPTCEPEVDPLRELVEVRYCTTHPPLTLGGADDQVRASLREFHPGSCDETGSANASFCQSLHRGE